MISSYGYQDIIRYAADKDKLSLSDANFDVREYASKHHKEIMEYTQTLLDNQLEQLWDELGDVAVCTGQELYESDPVKYEDYQYGQSLVIDSEWNGFPIGTDLESIWYWFDERHSKGVGWLMNEYEPEYE